MVGTGRGIHPEHLAHAIEQLGNLKKQDKRVLASKARGSSAAGRDEAARVLQQRAPRVYDGLVLIWDRYGGNAVHLWHVPIWDDLSVGKLVNLVSARLSLQLTIGMPAKTPRPSSVVPVRIAAATKQADGVTLRVHLTTEREMVYEDEPQTVPATVPVYVHLTPFNSCMVAEVYAGAYTARRAVEYVVGELAQVDVPKRASKKKERVLRPLRIKGPDAVALAQKLSLDEVGIDGPDATGELGTIRLESAQSGTRMLPLDRTVDIVARYYDSPKRFRGYQYIFAHPDGFEEHNLVRVYLHENAPGALSHITFSKRSSRPAAYAFLNELKGILV